MSTPILSLFLVAFGLILATHFFYKGTALTILPFTWFIAEDSIYGAYIWLLGVFILCSLLYFQYRLYGYDRNNKTINR